MKNRDFIFTSLQSWDIPIGSNAIDIAKEVSRNNRVLYVNSPLDMGTWLRKSHTPQDQYRKQVVKKAVNPLRKISTNLWVLDMPFVIAPVNFIPDGPLFDRVNRINNQKIFSYVKRVAEQLGWKDIIHFIDNDVYRSFYAKEFLSPWLSVYYRRDNLHPMRYWSKHVKRLEPGLIAKSDLVIANSAQLADYARRFQPKSWDVGQGVDISAYDCAIPAHTPETLHAIPRPIIGYIGDINSSRLDPDLIYSVAQQRTEYSFVMIGGEDVRFRNHPLHALNNVYFPGSIPKTEVARYLQGFDVCMNPQAVNEITVGNYPRKVDEYLAMGKPVVATRTPAMNMFSKHVYLCDDAADYVNAIDNALEWNNASKKADRIAFAHTHGWKENVENIYQTILQHPKSDL